MDRLTGKTAIVTGGAGGIGRGISECFMVEGARVTVFDLAKPTYAVASLQVDVTDAKAVKGAVDVALGEGPIDILVNNAGVEGRPGNPFTLNTAEDWGTVWQTNMMSAVFVSQAITPHFIERQGGCIINISSIAGLMPGPMSPPYSVSKAALITFTKIVAKQLAPKGIRANALAPGLVWTPHWERLAIENIRRYPEKFGHMSPREVYDLRVSEIVPLGREQTAHDVGLAAVFLASDEARNITGQVLNIDGGVVI